MDLQNEIKKTLLRYVNTRTHTATELENNNMDFFTDWFNNLDYLKDKPDQWGFHTIKNDYLDRKIPWALLKGEGEETIILIHHSDTVDTDDYGKYKNLAYDPEKLESIYREEIGLNEETRADLESGKWIFGRGVADMKGGGAIHLALFKKYSMDKDFKGNLLLVALPDEENLSAGMREATHLLDGIREKFNLKYILNLNAEPHEREEGYPKIYDGSIGKVMPLIYVRGKLAHVGQVFKGLNPISLLSEIIIKTDLRPDFIEKVGNTVTPPPTWLYMKDNKTVYDVSLPISAMGYMSVLTLKREPKEILQDLKTISQEAFKELIDRMNQSYEVYNSLEEVEGEDLGLEVKVLDYSELYKIAMEDSGENFYQTIEELKIEIKEKFHKNQINMVEGVKLLIEKTLEFIDDRSPLVVIAISPPYYPHVHNMDLQDTGHIDKAVKSIIKYSKENWKQEYKIKNYYRGITDLSYAMSTLDEGNRVYIEENMLLWGDLYSIDFQTIERNSAPVLNIGPWGKDFHKYTERVYREDLFERSPILIDRLIGELLGN